MKLNKSLLRSIAVLIVVVAIYNIAAFLIPFQKTTVFWIAYCFGFFAILIQVYVLNVAFNSGTTVKSKFYGYPIARIGIIYAVVQLILTFIAMAVGMFIPVWVATLIFAILLGLAVLGFIATDANRDEIVRQDQKIIQEVAFMRNLQSKMNVISTKSSGTAAKKALTSLAEDFRYSDPVSKPALAEIEHELSVSVADLERAVVEDNEQTIVEACASVKAVLDERNRLCKLNKSID